MPVNLYGDEAQNAFFQTVASRWGKGKELEDLIGNFGTKSYYEPQRPRSIHKWNYAARQMNENPKQRERVIGNLGAALRGNDPYTNNASTRDFAGPIALGLSQNAIPMSKGGSKLVGKHKFKTLDNSELVYNKWSDLDMLRMVQQL